MANAAVTSDFTMHGARAAIAAGMKHIEEQVRGIERAIEENPALVFDLAKTVVESACKTILADRGVAFSGGDDLPKLFNSVTANVPFAPPGTSGTEDARKSLLKTLNGLRTALHGVCELRNACGFASHGSEGPRPAMERVQALLAAQAADAIVGFLHRVHRQERLPTSRLAFDDNDAFNTYVDEANSTVRIFELEYRPSEVLFSVDQQAYRDALSTYEPDTMVAEADPTVAGSGSQP